MVSWFLILSIYKKIEKDGNFWCKKKKKKKTDQLVYFAVWQMLHHSSLYIFRSLLCNFIICTLYEVIMATVLVYVLCLFNYWAKKLCLFNVHLHQSWPGFGKCDCVSAFIRPVLETSMWQCLVFGLFTIYSGPFLSLHEP